MNNLKHVSIWILIITVCVLLAMQIVGRERSVAITITELFQVADLNVQRGDVPPDAPAGGLGPVKGNLAFKGDLRDTGTRIEGKLLLDSKVKLPASVQEKIDKASKETKSDASYILFSAEYLERQGENVLAKMDSTGVLGYKPTPQSTFYTQLFLSLLIPLVLIAALWLLFIRQVQSSGNKAMSFGKSRAKLIAEGQVKVGFDDVAGVDEAKEELREVVDFLKDPKKFSRLGGRIPKGVLLYGPPGTGKTLLAKAIAGEANVPFFSISGSDFVEMFVGVGASRVRDLFEQAKKSKPCLIFIDEIDAVGRHRFAGIGGGHDEREQTLNQLLVEMDGFATNEGVILIAATNRPDVLDPALLRPGRFDRQIAVDYPDVEGRVRILKVHGKNVKMAQGVDLISVAKGTPGFSGADLANVINEAALLAARANKGEVDQLDLEEAKDRVMMGPERRSMRISDEEKRATAIHEAGHAIAARYTEHADPVHKITIVPRGRSLGLTKFLPLEEKHCHTKTELKARLVMALGGLAAESIVLGVTGTGVGDDLNRVTQIARRMICEFGMSERLGPRTFGESRANVFVGRDGSGEGRNYSEDVAQIIDEEVKLLVDEAHKKSLNLLNEHRSLLDRVTDALVERETLSADDFEAIIRGEELPPLFKKGDGAPPKPPTAEPERTRVKAPPRISDLLDGPRQVPS